MSDFNASVFLLAMAGGSAIAVFLFKKMVIALVSGFAWGALAIYQFQLVYSGDPDIGTMTYAFAWACVVCAMVMFTAQGHILKIPGVNSVKDDRDQWEIDQDNHQKYVDKIKKRRPKRKSAWE